MSVLLRAWAIIVVVTKRLLSQRWLALATALGLLVSVALVMSVPLYADAVYFRVLHEQLSGGSDNEPASRPPFAFMFRYLGAWGEPVDWEDIEPLDKYMTGAVAPSIGLPQKFIVRYFKTDKFRVFPQADVAYADIRDPLAWISIASASDFEDHVNILEGTFPPAAEISQNSTVDVLVSEELALELGLQVGESYTAFARRKTEDGEQNVQLPLRISGVWSPRDPEEEYWFYDPRSLSDEMIVSEETYRSRIVAYMDKGVYLGLWYMVLDGSNVHATDALSLLSRITAVQQKAAAVLPSTRLDVSPANPLAVYWHSSRLLTILLYAFSVPIIGLILAFIGLVVGLSVGRRRNEIAVLRSRGATALQVIGIAALEGLLLGGIALAAGSPTGMAIARVIGKARRFLDFSLESDLRVGVTMVTLRYGAAAVGAALVALVLPTVSAARHTVVTYKQERARELRRPWWQRAWLDVLLLIPSAYGIYTLRQQGNIAAGAVVGGGSTISDPFENPLLFLIPALGIFAMTLFVLRILPAIMAVVSWIVSRVGAVSLLLAVQHLARTPRSYTAPLMLLVLTLSLSAFTASLAETLDAHLYDQTFYKHGAHMQLFENGESTESSSAGDPGGAVAQESDGESEENQGPRWLFLPVSEHLKVPGVRAAARVGEYKASTRLSGGVQTGTFIGVDRVDFAQVAFWRDDFAPRSLGSLMNSLANYPDGLLVPRTFMARHSLRGGDTIRVRVQTYGVSTELDLKVAGSFDLFPTWYPEEGPLFVGNLDTLFEQAGGQFPYDVWLRTDSEVNFEEVALGVRDLRFAVLDWNAPLDEVADEQKRPQRQGLFGLLSVGFMAAALLTVLGFLLYAFFSFRRRFIELGVLRAIGLSSGQMTAFLAWELALLVLTGLVVGTGLGVWMSDLFIPYLQVGAGPSAHTPPFVVQIAWSAIFRIYELFGLLFVVALGGLAALLLRMKIFQAVKLGETA